MAIYSVGRKRVILALLLVAVGLPAARLGPVVNLKAMPALTPPDAAERARLAPLFPRADTILAASTHAGEEALILVDPDLVRQALRRKRYEAVTMAHSETSTGVLSPLEEIARVVREESDALILVDAISIGQEYGPSSFHPGGAQHAFVDGSVQFLSETMEATVYDALTTRAGGEVVGEY